jgi:hypothetical protein
MKRNHYPLPPTGATNGQINRTLARDVRHVHKPLDSVVAVGEPKSLDQIW